MVDHILFTHARHSRSYFWFESEQASSFKRKRYVTRGLNFLQNHSFSDFAEYFHSFNCKFFLQWTIFFSPMPGTQGVIFDLNQSRLVPLKEKGTLQEGWTSFKTTASQTLLSLLIMWTTVTHSTANSHSHISPTFPGFQCLWDRDRSPSWRPRPSPPSGQWSSRCCH